MRRARSCASRCSCCSTPRARSIGVAAAGAATVGSAGAGPTAPTPRGPALAAASEPGSRPYVFSTICASKATITSAIRRPTMPIQPRCGCAALMSTAAPLIPRLVHQLVLLDPRHHFPQFAADLLDRVLGGHAPSRQHRRRAGTILEDEVARVLAALDARERRAHRILRGRV